jgi:hypothetical protein
VKRIFPIALRHLRRIARERLVTWGVILAVVAWVGAPALRPSPAGAAALMLSIALLTTALCSAGAIADEMASGAYMLDALHGARPIELVVGAAIGIFAAVLPAALVPAVGLLTAGEPSLAAALLLIAVVLVATIAWSTLAVMLGTLLPGKGNSAVLVPLFLFGGLAPSELSFGPLPGPLAEALRLAWSALPLHAHVAAIRDQVLTGSHAGSAPWAALIGGPIIFTLLATYRLRRLEAVARWRQ